MDTGLRHDVAMPSTQTECRPRLFVYRLPSGYRSLSTRTGHAFGNALQGTGSLKGLTLYSTMTYGTGAAAFEEALHHPCRTRDPAAADLFFVPAFSSNVNTNYVRSWCAEQSSSRAERVRHRASCDAKAIWARLAEQARTTAGNPYFEIMPADLPDLSRLALQPHPQPQPQPLSAKFGRG